MKLPTKAELISLLRRARANTIAPVTGPSAESLNRKLAEDLKTTATVLEAAPGDEFMPITEDERKAMMQMVALLDRYPTVTGLSHMMGLVTKDVIAAKSPGAPSFEAALHRAAEAKYNYYRTNGLSELGQKAWPTWENISHDELTRIHNNPELVAIVRAVMGSK
jgi:hypothetical protein